MSATGDLLDQKDEEIVRLLKHNKGLQQRLAAYQITVNTIDDFFEYTNESITDRKFIHRSLDLLTTKLKRIHDDEKGNASSCGK